jgi:hypothetical protein
MPRSIGCECRRNAESVSEKKPTGWRRLAEEATDIRHDVCGRAARVAACGVCRRAARAKQVQAPLWLLSERANIVSD